MFSPLDLLRAPLSFGFGLAQTAAELGAGAARAAFGAVAGGGDDGSGPLSDVESQPPRTTAPAARAATPRPTPTSTPTALREVPPLPKRSPTPPSPAPPSAAPAEAPPHPLADAHVDTESVLVAAVAEEGAQDGAGPELHIDEPWEGYGSMKAPDIRDRLQTAGRETLAAVELYEGLHKARSSVLETASRRLEQLS